MRTTSKGQVTIPADIREKAGLLPHMDVEFQFDGKVVRIIRAQSPQPDGRGARVVAHLRGRGDIAMNTDSIMALTRSERMTAIWVNTDVPLTLMARETRRFCWSVTPTRLQAS